MLEASYIGDTFSPQILDWSSIKGWMKKKRDSTLISMIDSSVDRYFQFWCEGKVLCYYETDNIVSPPPLLYYDINDLLILSRTTRPNLTPSSSSPRLLQYKNITIRKRTTS